MRLLLLGLWVELRVPLLVVLVFLVVLVLLRLARALGM